MTKCKEHQLPLKYCERCLKWNSAYHDTLIMEHDKRAATIREYAATIRALRSALLACSPDSYYQCCAQPGWREWREEQARGKP